MAEREIWEVVAERYGMLKKMQGTDGYDLAADLTLEALRGLSREEIEPILEKHGLNADKFFGNNNFWQGVEAKLKSDE